MRNLIQAFKAGIAGAVTVAVLISATPSIKTDGNVETDAQLVSTVGRGTAPLVVTSSDVVLNLNADQLDGRHSTSFALASELLAAIAALENPNPPCFNLTDRFVDCLNGTVTDTETSLIYLKTANCFPLQDYPTANQSAATLANGQCGLTDGSRAGDWRLMTLAEWSTILDSSCPSAPKIEGNNGCYSNTSSPWATEVPLVTDRYWTSTSITNESARAVNLASGLVPGTPPKSSTFFVWPVRGGQ